MSTCSRPHALPLRVPRGTGSARDQLPTSRKEMPSPAAACCDVGGRPGTPEGWDPHVSAWTVADGGAVILFHQPVCTTWPGEARGDQRSSRDPNGSVPLALHFADAQGDLAPILTALRHALTQPGPARFWDTLGNKTRPLTEGKSRNTNNGHRQRLAVTRG